MGTAGFDRPEDEWPRRWAEAYVGLLRRREALLAARPGHALAAQPGLARARRLPRRRPRQLGAALPHHLGHRPRRASSPSSAGCARRPRAAWWSCASATASTSCQSPGGDGHRRRAARCSRRARSRAASASDREEVGDFELDGAGRGRHHRRHRRQPRPRAREVARAARRAARADALRRARPRRRAHARDRHAARAPTRSTPTACGTTSRASTTGTRSGPCTRSGSSPARRRCGSTRAGERLPGPLYPGYDTLGTLAHIQQTGHDYTWFVLTQKIIEKEFALSGSEQNPDTTSKSVRARARRSGSAAARPRPVQAFMDHGEDFIVERGLPRAWCGA